jgi:nicotinate dehydrogenase subunit B
MKLDLGGTTGRRDFLAAGGTIVLAFCLQPGAAWAQAGSGRPDAGDAEKLAGSLARTPLLDAWIRLHGDGRIEVFTGKVELGQGIKTALLQVAAEGLQVAPQRIALVTADTARTPDERYTAGSQSMQDSATAILEAAAQVRELLLEMAATRLGVEAAAVRAVDAAIHAEDGRKLTYAELAAGIDLHVRARPAALLATTPRKYIGQPLARVDIPPKLAGVPSYVQDLRLDGMVHARVVRPPSYDARLAAIDTERVTQLPGVVRVVRNGSFIAVVALREFEAIVAARELSATARWREGDTLPGQERIFSHLLGLQVEDIPIAHGAGAPSGRGVIEARYLRHYQIHGAIGPSCAVALYRQSELTVWTHSQGVYPLQRALAELLALDPARVRCIHMEGSGCYGHNGADDAAADAALIAVMLPGKPVRVQWMRQDEHRWEPFGAAMVSAARARLQAGRVRAFRYDVWSNSHNERPGPAGNLLPALHLARPFRKPRPKPAPQPTGGGDRNAIPLYDFGNTRVVNHFIPEMPLRVSALRALGAYMNVFALESFVDELALAAGADPVAFRLEHLHDERAREVVRTAAGRFGWDTFARGRLRGRGIGFARYKNLAAYCAVACEVEIERESGRLHMLRAVAAIDSGEAVNPAGIRNQVEGGIVQSLSWTLFEAVRFDRTRILSADWSSYPILRFPDLPERIDVHVLSRPGMPFLGTGEAAQGPTAAAVGNALADAIGSRLRELPLARANIKRALVV